MYLRQCRSRRSLAASAQPWHRVLASLEGRSFYSTHLGFTNSTAGLSTFYGTIVNKIIRQPVGMISFFHSKSSQPWTQKLCSVVRSHWFPLSCSLVFLWSLLRLHLCTPVDLPLFPTSHAASIEISQRSNVHTWESALSSERPHRSFKTMLFRGGADGCDWCNFLSRFIKYINISGLPETA